MYHKFSYACFRKDKNGSLIPIVCHNFIGTEEDRKEYEALVARRGWEEVALKKVAPATAEEYLDYLVERHDLTYAYSDDHSYWVAGERSLDKIRRVAKEVARDVAVNIWNAWVDKKIVPDSRQYFYWKCLGES